MGVYISLAQSSQIKHSTEGYSEGYRFKSSPDLTALAAATMGKLTDRFIRNAGPGRYFDGDGLLLECVPLSARSAAKWDDGKAGVSRSWIYRFTSPLPRPNGKPWRRDMGLGGYPLVSLSDARKKALAARVLIEAGKDPLEERQAEKVAKKAIQKTVPKFSEVATTVIDDACADGSKKRRLQWERYLGPSYCGDLHDKPVNEITTVDISKTLAKVWTKKPEAARKLLPAIRRVFEKARIILRDDHSVVIANPANWNDLKAMGLSAPKKLTKGHQPSLPYAQMGEFIGELRKQSGVSSLMLEFLILTNVRTDAALGAEWREFDTDGKVWIVPLDRLKDREHRNEPFRVPLSKRALAILEEAKIFDGKDYVFPSSHGGKMSNMAMLATVKRMHEAKKDGWKDPVQNKKIVVHGFRASFKTWAKEQTATPEAVIELCMGHVISGDVERAYNRTDLLETRQKLMQAWADWCEPKPVT